MKPMLAEDYVADKLVFPAWDQPKIDGVRALHFTGEVTGRSLKQHKNRHVSRYFSDPVFSWLDGEMAVESETHPDLCRLTSSALGTIAGEPWALWHVFDYMHPEVARAEYEERYQALLERVMYISKEFPDFANHLRVVPYNVCHSLEEFLAREEHYLDLGYEGIMYRRPRALYKHGRPTLRSAEMLRGKRFVDAEAVVSAIQEGQTNCNEAQINELGLQFRSSHQDGMAPNGMVGTMTGILLKDVEYNGEVLFKAGESVTISAGSMTKPMRKHYFENPSELLQKVVKFKFFPKGIKDKPRFPTFQSIRLPEDM